MDKETYLLSSCFPHVVNLACKAVLEKVTDMNCAGDESAVTMTAYAPANTFDPPINNDPIVMIRNLIRTVSNCLSYCSLS